MKPLLLFLFVFIAMTGAGQSLNHPDKQACRSGAEQLFFADSVCQAIGLASKDIASGTPYLLLESGIAPVAYLTDSIFENAYKVHYRESGCTGPDHELSAAYNGVVFTYLEKRFGRKWRRAIRKDVVGYKSWKRKQRQKIAR